MKIATFLLFACLLANVSLQCETPSEEAVIETLKPVPGGTIAILRPNATTEWVNCLLWKYKDNLTDPHNSSYKDVYAVNVGDVDIVGEGGILDLKLMSLTVFVKYRPQIVLAEVKASAGSPTGQIRASIRFGVHFEASFDSMYHPKQLGAVAEQNCSGNVRVIIGEQLFDIKLNGRSVAERRLPKLDSVTIELLSSWPERRSLWYELSPCEHKRNILRLLWSIMTHDNSANFRSQIRKRLEAKLTRNLRLVLEA